MQKWKKMKDKITSMVLLITLLILPPKILLGLIAFLYWVVVY